jgi:hypothetical protein
MLPVQVEFPKFVADQLLTSEDLNQLFGYLDEQNRMTRTNLIGIGIVCGLQLQINPSKTQVTITKGCGVTSEGYLISVNTKAYSQYKKYKVDTARVYDKFYKLDGGGNKIPMNVWELKQPAVDPELEDIDEGFLKDKVILLFVELKEEDNKNCDPNSCDDKGINVTVSFLPMAVTTEDASLLMGNGAGGFGMNTYTVLPELRMKRWDVANTSPVYSQDIFQAYLKLLDQSFLEQVETTLKNVYAVFGSVVAAEYGGNPFTGLAAKFSYLHDGTINLNQAIHLQYQYDLFSDLLLAYQEFRKTGTYVLSTCCPDSDLFPRHLLLGEAIPSPTSGMLAYRHYFIYSPLFDQHGMVGELKTLFKRLVLLIESFFLPTVSGNNTKEDTSLRITPSMLWDVPLSKKAIPYYYLVNSGTQPLYLSWDHRRTLLHDAKRHLSYHATQYNNGSDDFVVSPLSYDLEPYNFLRIEGIVGKSYVHVLRQVKQQIQKNRLPVDIIALSTDTGTGFNNQLTNGVNRIDRSTDALEMLCHFQDLESMYDSMRREILCMLCKELKYYYDFTLAIANAFFRKEPFEGGLSQVALFDVCSKGYVIKDRSLGLMIEFLHRKGFTDETLTLESFFNAFGFNVQDVDNDGIPDELKGQASVIYLALLNFFKIPLGIIRLSTLLTEDLADFDVKAYCTAAEKLADYAKSLKALFSIFSSSQQSSAADPSTTVNPNAQPGGSSGTVDVNTNRILVTNNNRSALTQMASTGNGFATILLLLLLLEDLMDHLDVLIYNCKCSALLSLKKDYMRRYLMLTRLRQFGYFNQLHPGMQHKAGVPMGGTFIIVYHARSRSRMLGNLNRGGGAATHLHLMTDTMSDFSAAYASAYVEKRTDIAGFVMDEGNNPIPGASVFVAETNEGTMTSSNGSFKFTGSRMPYTLVVEAVGYETYEVVKTDDDTNMRIVLQEAKENILEQLQQGAVIADFYLPYRCCSDCPPIQYIVNDVVDPDKPGTGLVANAGPDQTVLLEATVAAIARPTAKVRLHGSATAAPGRTITFFQWKQIGNVLSPAPSIISETSAQTDVENLIEGEYIFQFLVTDDQGAVATDDVKITVKAGPKENKAPVAKASASLFPAAANTIMLDSKGSIDEDGFIKEYKWVQIAGLPVTIEGATLETAFVRNIRPDAYTFQLIVTDDDGATGTANASITIAAPANQPPKASAVVNGPVIISANGKITLNGSASTDPEGGVLTYNWIVLSGSANNPLIEKPDNESTDVTGLITGSYRFKLTVKDEKGESDSAEVSVNVTVRDTIPQKTCGPLSDIIKLFDGLEAADARRFPTFTNADGFTSMGNVKELFAAIRTIENRNSSQQINFFSSSINGAPIEEQLIKWLSELHKIIVERKDIRFLALLLYRILQQLAMYIVCIQPEDFDVAKVPLSKLFTLIQRHTKQWSELIATGVFTPAEVSTVKTMGEEMAKEMERTQANGEEGSKGKYLKQIKQISDLIKAIG